MATSRGEQQRAVITSAVAELLATVPIGDLSVTRIAQHAGVTRPAFYFYFDSKYAVVAAALEDVWREIEASTAGLDSYDFAEPPAVFSDRMVENAVSVWRTHAALLNACVQATDPALIAIWDAFMDNLCTRLAHFVERIAAGGSITPVTADVPALIRSLVGMTIWVLLDEARHSDPALAERAMTAARKVWLAAVWN